MAPAFGKAKQTSLCGLVDVHCHILPGVDDGSANIRSSLRLLDAEYRDGVRSIILTPHYRKNAFQADDQTVLDAYGKLCRESDLLFPDLALYLGCEVHAFVDMVDAIHSHSYFRLAGSHYVLVEFSGDDSQRYIKNLLYDLCSKGYIPLVAHVERCMNIRDDYSFLSNLVAMGVRLQANAASVTGHDGLRVQHICRNLMERDLLFCIASDTHDRKGREPMLKTCADYISKKMGLALAQALMIENPGDIIMSGATNGTEQAGE